MAHLVRTPSQDPGLRALSAPGARDHSLEYDLLQGQTALTDVHTSSVWDQSNSYFLFFFSDFFAAAGLCPLAALAFSVCAAAFAADATNLAVNFAPFFSLLFDSFGFGCSLIPESFRRIFSRSSGVLPLPVNCIANTWFTIASNFGPAGMPIAVNSYAIVGITWRRGFHLFKYVRL